MNTDISNLLILGFIGIIIGVMFLISMVFEISQDKKQRWLLGLGLGSGIIAFTFKIILVVTFNSFPNQVLAVFPKQNNKYDPNANLHQQKILTTQLNPSSTYSWKSLPPMAPSPLDNPTSPEKISLGMKLFFDKRLSLDRSLSCASCHELSEEKGGSDGLPSSVGIDGQVGTRNAPTVLNAAFQRLLFWDGRAQSLEEQAKGPLVNPTEMGMLSFSAVEDRVGNIPEYKQLFEQVFPEKPSISIDNIAKAIATYERTLITPDSPYDQFINGDTDALTESQIRGMELFESTGCILCHSGPNFSGASIYGKAAYRIFPATPNTEYESKYQLTRDLGLASNSDSDRGIWRIPSLRNVSRTAPYFHNGSVDSLEEAVRIMANVQLKKKLSNKTSDNTVIYWSATTKELSTSTNQALNDDEVMDIVAFLKSLNGVIPQLAKLETK